MSEVGSARTPPRERRNRDRDRSLRDTTARHFSVMLPSVPNGLPDSNGRHSLRIFDRLAGIGDRDRRNPQCVVQKRQLELALCKVQCTFRAADRKTHSASWIIKDVPRHSQDAGEFRLPLAADHALSRLNPYQGRFHSKARETVMTAPSTIHRAMANSIMSSATGNPLGVAMGCRVGVSRSSRSIGR